VRQVEPTFSSSVIFAINAAAAAFGSAGTAAATPTTTKAESSVDIDIKFDMLDLYRSWSRDRDLSRKLTCRLESSSVMGEDSKQPVMLNPQQEAPDVPPVYQGEGAFEDHLAPSYTSWIPEKPLTTVGDARCFIYFSLTSLIFITTCRPIPHPPSQNHVAAMHEAEAIAVI
jgi:hypothetical protein